jgi:putative transposase
VDKLRVLLNGRECPSCNREALYRKPETQLKFRKAIKFRLYPTHAQETLLRETLERCRGVYNSFLHWRRFDYDTLSTSLSYLVQKKALPLWKKEHPDLSRVYSQVLQDVCRRADCAYQSYFDRLADYQLRKAQGKLHEDERCPGPPRFKGKGVYDSITYTQSSAFAVGEKCITFSKLACIKAVIHRQVPGVAKTCTIRRLAGKWFACISCEVEAQCLPESSEIVGVDMGLNHFAVTSDEEFIDNPRFFRTDEKALAKAQRKFEKVKNQHRTPARRKAKRIVSRIHERIRNRRHNFVHQETRKLVNRYQLIAVEKLSVENMMATPAPKVDPATGKFLPNGAAAKSGLNKSIADAAWSMFRHILTYKAESAGRVVVNVNPAYTSQDCSGCGTRVPKTLKERWHHCTNPECLLSLHRDVNAAMNILKIALSILRNSVGLDSIAA